MVKEKKMKTTSVLTRIIPTLDAVRGSSAFNVVIAGAATPMAEDLRTAANDDRIAAGALVDAMKSVAVAKTVADQQAAMAAALVLSNALLVSIADGTAPRLDSVTYEARDLLKRIATDIASMRDVFTPDAAVMDRIRKDASELTTLIDAEIMEGMRPGDHAMIAAKVFDNADRLATSRYGDREAASLIIARDVELLAA